MWWWWWETNNNELSSLSAGVSVRWGGGTGLTGLMTNNYSYKQLPAWLSPRAPPGLQIIAFWQPGEGRQTFLLTLTRSAHWDIINSCTVTWSWYHGQDHFCYQQQVWLKHLPGYHGQKFRGSRVVKRSFPPAWQQGRSNITDWLVRPCGGSEASLTGARNKEICSSSRDKSNSRQNFEMALHLQNTRRSPEKWKCNEAELKG